jgi:hypothetical protein
MGALEGEVEVVDVKGFVLRGAGTVSWRSRLYGMGTVRARWALGLGSGVVGVLAGETD